MIYLDPFAFSCQFVLVEEVPILVFVVSNIKKGGRKEIRLWRFCLFLVLPRGGHPYQGDQIVNYPEC